MSIVTVRAPDSATAMDEVVRRLGPDALILSTRGRDGQVEIVASDGPPRAAADPVPPPAPPMSPPVAPPVAPEAGFSAILARAMRPGAAARPAADAAATVLAAPRVVLVGPPGAGKSALALQIAGARLDRDPDAPAPVLRFVGTGSHCDGAWLAEKAFLLGLPVGFAAAGGPAPASAAAPDLAVVSDLHPDPVAAAGALLAGPGALALLVLPAGLRADRVAALARRWGDLVAGAVVTLAPGEAAMPEDEAALAAAGLEPVWISRRGRLADALAAFTVTAPAARRAPAFSVQAG